MNDVVVLYIYTVLMSSRVGYLYIMVVSNTVGPFCYLCGSLDLWWNYWSINRYLLILSL